MTLVRFDPAADAASVRACHEIYVAGAPLDDPLEPPMSGRRFAAELIFGMWTSDPSQVWLATDATGQAAGWYHLTLPQREDRQNAFCWLRVHPSRRREGLGRTLIRHAAGQAHGLGRHTLLGNARQGSPGDAFTVALGAKPGITEARRVLALHGADTGHAAALRRHAHDAARGYSLTSWEGPAPAEERARVAGVSAAMADAPHDNETQIWDAERIRESGLRKLSQGLRSYSVIATHDGTGEIAGLTELNVDPVNPAWGYQEITAVTRPHRGHRLGLLLKLAMLDILARREPQLGWIVTGNATTNGHMIAINEALGFRVADHWPIWKLDVAAVLPEDPA